MSCSTGTGRIPASGSIALYPAEGTLWTDHPLALLELGQGEGEQAVTKNQQRAYQAFSEFLTGTEAQQHLLAAGYRPADLSITLDSPGSPFANNDAVDWREPQTTLQMPSTDVVNVVRDYWYYTKRPTNVYLVVDTSGSMEGSKLTAAKAALKAFLEQIAGDRDRVGIVEFGSGLKDYSLLAALDDETRQRLNNTIDNMEAAGGTALIDAVYAGVATLQREDQPDAINAVVVMTDGLENESGYNLYDLQALRAPEPVAAHRHLYDRLWRRCRRGDALRDGAHRRRPVPPCRRGRHRRVVSDYLDLFLVTVTSSSGDHDRDSFGSAEAGTQ